MDDDEYVRLGDDTDFLDPNVATKLKANLTKNNKPKPTMNDDDDMADSTATNGKKRKSVTTTDSGKLDFTNLEKKIQEEERVEKIMNRKPTESEI
eukprot:UN07522